MTNLACSARHGEARRAGSRTRAESGTAPTLGTFDAQSRQHPPESAICLVRSVWSSAIATGSEGSCSAVTAQPKPSAVTSTLQNPVARSHS
jgi:hypothetical protein